MYTWNVPAVSEMGGSYTVSSAHFCVEKESDPVDLLFPFNSGDWLVLIPSQGLFLTAACSVPPEAELNRLLKSPFVEGPSALLLPPRARGCFVKILQEHRKSTVAFAKTQWAGLCEDRD